MIRLLVGEVGGEMNFVNGSILDVDSSDSFSSQRKEVFSHVNLAFYILDEFGIDDTMFFISDIFDGLLEICLKRRMSGRREQIYIGGMKSFRKSLFGHMFLIERESMSVQGISIKYRVCEREVYRAIAELGCGVRWEGKTVRRGFHES